jgi:hypothetical protein
MKKKRKKIEQAAARRAHFERNGDLAQWRGRAVYFEDRKKKKNKRACRSFRNQEE